jgi:hypothetical protein
MRASRRQFLPNRKIKDFWLRRSTRLVRKAGTLAIKPPSRGDSADAEEKERLQ